MYKGASRGQQRRSQTGSWGWFGTTGDSRRRKPKGPKYAGTRVDPSDDMRARKAGRVVRAESGVVKSFNPRSGRGVIEGRDGKEIGFRLAAFGPHRPARLPKGAAVEFLAAPGFRDLQAIQVRRVEQGTSARPARRPSASS